MTAEHSIPTIDISAYIDPGASADARAKLIDEVKTACSQYGFIQIKGHGVPVKLQQKIIDCSKTLFDLPQAQKDALSLKNSVSRRGYERIGDQVLDAESLPDQKEVYFCPITTLPTQIAK